MMDVGLRFLLRGGGFLDVVLPRSQAEEILRKFDSGEYRLKGIRSLAGRCTTGRTWWVSVEDVLAVHTEHVDVKKIQSVLSGGMR